MKRTRIKICGVCRPEDAVAAARAGADAVGIVLHPASARFVTADLARLILAALPPWVTPVGLFVDAAADTILGAARDLNLRCIQLHGHEEPALIATLKPLTVIKAVRVEKHGFVEGLAGWRAAIAAHALSNLRGLVLETGGSPVPGGSGVANDWPAVARAKAEGAFEELPSIIAAGGLTPATVAEVVRAVSPWAVDVSSGVESSVRAKSSAKIMAFSEAVREVDRESD